MLVFWIVAAVLVLVALGFILLPLLRPNAVIKNDASAEKRAIFRQQFDELEQDKNNAVLDVTQYEVAKAELERRFLDEVGATSATASMVGNSAPDRRLALILLIVLPLVAVALYFKIGSPISITIPAVAPNTVAMELPAAEHSAMAGDIEPLLELLKKKLESKPNDGAGWALLARSYVEIRRHAEAVPAYEKAVKVIQDDPQLLADYADALAVVNGHSLVGKPEELVKQALKLDPHHPKALMLAATAAFDRKDYKQAIAYWERLQKDLPADSELLPEVKASLNEAHTLSGDKVSATQLEAMQPQAEQKSVEASSVGISGTVRVSKALSGKLDPFATVFIFARATQGQPMPLAIVRTTVRELPYTYHLDDSSALMPSLKLSQANEVVLVARISKTGDAKAQAGDLQGISAPTKPNGAMDVEINQVVP